MTGIDQKPLHRPPEEESTPEGRKKWAFDYATQNARVGRVVTVRALQAATRDRFGRGIGNREATGIVRDVIRITNDARRATQGNTERDGHGKDGASGGAQTLKLIARLMRESDIRAIELLDDGSMRLTPI